MGKSLYVVITDASFFKNIFALTFVKFTRKASQIPKANYTYFCTCDYSPHIYVYVHIKCMCVLNLCSLASQ